MRQGLELAPCPSAAPHRGTQESQRLTPSSRRTHVAPLSEHASDLALIRAVIRREDGAFANLEAKTEGIVGACLTKAIARWPAMRTERDDLAQSFEVFLVEDDFRVLRTYAGRAALTTWIHSVAIRFFYRKARRLSAHKTTPLEPNTLALVRDSAADPEARAVANAQLNGVRKAIAECTADEQAMLRLIYEQELPAHDVGKILGISGAGVRMKKKRLLARLASRLEGLWKQ